MKKQVTVQKMLEDKDTLEHYILNMKLRRADKSTIAEPNLNEKINAAIELCNVIKDNLSKQTIPSAIEGKTVGQAFLEAQKGTENFYKSLLNGGNLMSTTEDIDKYMTATEAATVRVYAKEWIERNTAKVKALE